MTDIREDMPAHEEVDTATDTNTEVESQVEDTQVETSDEESTQAKEPVLGDSDLQDMDPEAAAKIRAERDEKAEQAEQAEKGEHSDKQDGEEAPKDEKAAESEKPSDEAQADADLPKYKSLDKEYTFPKYLHGVMKDPEAAKELKDVFEKAAGLDHIKPKFLETRENLKSANESIQKRYQPMESEIQSINADLEKGSLKSLVKSFRIPKEMILREAAELLRYEDMSPEERRQVDSQREREASAERQQLQLEQQQQANADTAARLGIMELDSAITRNEVLPVAQAMDAKYGAGAFRKEVIKLGQLIYHQTGNDTPVDTLVKELTERHGWMAQQMSATGTANPRPAAPAAPQAPKAQPAAAPRAKPKVIPNVSGRSVSPAAKTPGSLKELKKIAKEKAANGYED